jgi:hypothetical protein
MDCGLEISGKTEYDEGRITASAQNEGDLYDKCGTSSKHD